jgi:hypothetical protein
MTALNESLTQILCHEKLDLLADILAARAPDAGFRDWLGSDAATSALAPTLVPAGTVQIRGRSIHGGPWASKSAMAS